MSNFRHGDAKNGAVSRLHNIWRGILKRCNSRAINPNPKYAGRGISVANEWHRYEVFRAWALTNGYLDHLTIERVNNDGNYEPENCIWILAKDQASNRRTSRFITHNGKTQTVAQWSREIGIQSSLISYRLSADWSTLKALSEPPATKSGRPRKHPLSSPHYELVPPGGVL